MPFFSRVFRGGGGEFGISGSASPLAVYHLARHLRDGGDPATLGGLGPMVGTAGATVWPNPLKILPNQIKRRAPQFIQKTGIFKRRAILMADAGLAVLTGDRGATPDGGALQWGDATGASAPLPRGARYTAHGLPASIMLNSP